MVLFLVFQVRFGTVSGTGSMLPTLDKNDITVCIVGDYGIGDIVIFRSPYGGNIIHRIVDENKDGYTTKGDHNDTVDAYIVTEEMIIGKLLFKFKRF